MLLDVLFDFLPETMLYIVVSSLVATHVQPSTTVSAKTSKRGASPNVSAMSNTPNDGGAFIFAEKVLCKNAKFQDMLTFMYYDYKKLSFTEKEIFDKERSIHDQMHLWSEFKLFEMLRSAGFVSSYTQLFWRNHLFVGILAVKAAKYR
jgi:hypothetical protein